jgi:hypothetical protein
MEDSQEDQVVVILSPQDWNHQFISKHHYAVEFSKKYKTIFVSPTICQVGKFYFKKENINIDNNNLFLVQLVLPLPDWFRFKFNKVYTKLNRIALNLFLKKQFKEKITLLIDFGCHKLIDRLDKFCSTKSIYFPVDDFPDLPIETRNADKLYTVSSNIKEKFEKSNISITWINHGLSSLFVEKARLKLQELKKSTISPIGVRKKVGYSGNVAIPFLDREVVLNTIADLPDMEFHFFGNYKTNDSSAISFTNNLKKHQNVVLHGQISTEELADQLFQMDVLWLCYKADGKNYHLENSHKILEYLSTGKPFVSSPIKYLKNADKDFIYQENNEKHKKIFKFIENNKIEDSKIVMNRIIFALKSSYQANVDTLIS